MSEYIERNAFLEKTRRQYCKDCDRRKGMKNGKLETIYGVGDAPCRACYIDDVLTDVEDFPAADVQPVVRGKWYWDNYKYDWTCYACGWPVDYHNPKDPWGKPEYSYCPNCGSLNKEDET